MEKRKGQRLAAACGALYVVGLSLLWFVAASVVLVRRASRRVPVRVPGRAAAVAGGLLALVLSSGLTACGDDDEGDPGISRQDYIAQSGAICTANGEKAGQAFERIVKGAPRTAATAQRFVSKAVVPIFSDSVSRRAKLAAPEGNEQEIAGINKAGRKALAEFEQIAANPSRSLDLMRGKIPDPAKDYDERSRRYGIAKCGGDES